MLMPTDLLCTDLPCEHWGGLAWPLEIVTHLRQPFLPHCLSRVSRSFLCINQPSAKATLPSSQIDHGALSRCGSEGGDYHFRRLSRGSLGEPQLCIQCRGPRRWSWDLIRQFRYHELTTLDKLGHLTDETRKKWSQISTLKWRFEASNVWSPRLYLSTKQIVWLDLSQIFQKTRPWLFHLSKILAAEVETQSPASQLGNKVYTRTYLDVPQWSFALYRCSWRCPHQPGMQRLIWSCTSSLANCLPEPRCGAGSFQSSGTGWQMMS